MLSTTTSTATVRVIVKEKWACVADEYEAGLTNVLVPFKLNVQRLPMCICEPVCV